MMKLFFLFICCSFSLACGISVIRITPAGMVTENMELSILGNMDGDANFREPAIGSLKMIAKEDIVIPKVNMKCGDNFFLRSLDKKIKCWILINKDGVLLGQLEFQLFSTEQVARKFLKNSFTSSIPIKINEKRGKNNTCCMFSAMDEYPEMLLYATRGNFGFSVRGPREREVWDVKLAESILDFFLDQATWVPADEKEVAMALKRRKVRMAELRRQKEARYKKEQEGRELEEWKKEPCYGMPPLCGEAMAYDSSLAPVELLKHGESVSEELVIPNAHEGRITLDLVKKWGGKLFRVEGVGHLRNGIHAELKPCGKLEETMEQDSRVEILVAYARSRKEAMELLLRLRFYDPRNTKRDPRDVAAATVVKPGRVGDFDLGSGPVLGPDGALVKGSEQSAVYFLRGNTAVMVLSTDPGYPVLGMAQKLDAALEGNATARPD